MLGELLKFIELPSPRVIMLKNGILFVALVSLLVFAFLGPHQSDTAIPIIQEDSREGKPHATSEIEGKFVTIKRVFPRLRFDRPVFITGAGDGSGRLFVVEQAGVIRVFDPADHPDKEWDELSEKQKEATSEVFLDIRDRISRKGNEEGLIGLAFHPDFENNGQLLIHYSSSVTDNFGVVARFRVDNENKNRMDPKSEEILLRLKQPYRNHNGGTIAFGKDGMLYISFGDGGSANDPHGHGQNLESWLGTILRIDIDHKDGDQPYSVPKDNPFRAVENAKPEIWAFGLRNVWRFSFDRKTGELWAADVGQNKWEEVNVIKKGGNYGWNRYEANSIFRDKSTLSHGEHDPPVAVYARQWGWSITGGYVYRGRKYPELQGQYFYGDYVSGNLWRIKKDDNGKHASELVRRTGRSIASFGEGDDGELYLTSFDGGIYQVVATNTPEKTFSDWPQKLSESGLFESTAKKEVAADLIPYEVNAPFWSDGAEKARFIKLPKGATMKYRAKDAWELPVGTVIVKNFEGMHLRRKRMLETRLIKRTESGWEAATYVWDQNGRDAILAPGGKQFELYQPDRVKRVWNVLSWHAPSASECASCHVDAAGFVLGINTLQLNRDIGDTGKNQIETWAEKGWLELPEGFSHKKANRFCSPYDESEAIDRRARVWLDVNCSMCHRPNGPGNANIDLRYETERAEMNLIGTQPAQGNLGLKNALLVSPGSPDESLLLHRVKTLGEGRMPSVATNQNDEVAIQLLKEWIREMKK